MITFQKATTPEEFSTAKDLFKAYAKELGIDLSFQDFSNELKTIEKQYSKPEGALIIGYYRAAQPIGCFGIRKLEETICELKRMYIAPRFRAKGIGKQMMEKAIRTGVELGYEKMRLDTLPAMQPAIKLYKKYGFYEIGPYRYNPIEGTLYFEKEFKKTRK